MRTGVPAVGALGRHDRAGTRLVQPSPPRWRPGTAVNHVRTQSVATNARRPLGVSIARRGVLARTPAPARSISTRELRPRISRLSLRGVPRPIDHRPLGSRAANRLVLAPSPTWYE